MVLTFDSKGGVGADKHRARTRTAGRPAAALGVDSNVTADDECVAAVPRGRLNPVDGVEERRGGAVAGVFRVDTLDVGVASASKEVHEESLAGF